MTTTPLKGGFYNTSDGETMNKLYGLALCQGDLAPQGEFCKICLHNARNSILEDYTNKTQAIEWYESCFIKYSNQSFFGVVNIVGRTMCGTEQSNRIAANITTGMIAINSSLESYALVLHKRPQQRGLWGLLAERDEYFFAKLCIVSRMAISLW
ncbi:uncharacterized protein LOC120265219 [Dioscorea cayenensis subsp. rotundata]|uniref:Uncharacterized protein LOC120265219 n=1 Tax=Dioscorea cayennensis subsp. rotundata TaxID=55577 RepID=A0AB40BNP2_DIOCR|nr:uncharacterized protein LOC120265219 [Dioscorea cayenensis subsp. rotundata]